MTAVDQTVDADRILKSTHRAMWSLGDYAAVAAEIIPHLGATLIEACEIKEAVRVLDVAAGTGNAAIPAAMAGANVVACDLAPKLLEAGRKEATRLGVTLEWREADAEALPFDDNEFDAVVSCVGVMFAPTITSAHKSFCGSAGQGALSG